MYYKNLLKFFSVKTFHRTKICFYNEVNTCSLNITVFDKDKYF